MKRIPIERWSRQLLSPRKRPCCLLQRQQQAANIASIRRMQSTSTAMDLTLEDGDREATPSADSPQSSTSQSNSPSPERARHSAKLAALHARLHLPPKLPLETMARTLIDPSADPNIRLNNLTLSQVGGPILSYHVAEWLLCHYPRLPMTVLFAAAYAYNGPKTLQIIAKEWGVETAFATGPEVNAGLLQFSKMQPGTPLPSGGGTTRPGSDFARMRRGISSRNVYDDEFGDTIPKETEMEQEVPTETAYSNFVKAVIGAIYLHAGRAAAKAFIKQHVLSRHLQISSLFKFDNPVRELSRLCAREDFEFPTARILTETGRVSRTPVFVVGIFSGSEKLGEGAGASLNEARTRACIAALKAWYLYSPGNDVRVPSDMEEPNTKPWEPVHIDLGEIIH